MGIACSKAGTPHRALLLLQAQQQGLQQAAYAVAAYFSQPHALQARANKMLEDVNTGIAWVMEHIADLGGDSSNVTLVGQSAGAHLGSLALFHQVRAHLLSRHLNGSYLACAPGVCFFSGCTGSEELCRWPLLNAD